MNKIEHLLVKLGEECAEVTQSCSKACLFGATDGYPDRTTTNAEDIMTEALEAIAVIELLQEEGVLPVFSEQKQYTIKESKKERVAQWMSHSRKQGCLE